MDSTLLVIGAVFTTGCVGGCVAGLLSRDSGVSTKKQLLGYRGELCGSQFPGLIVNTLLGGVAAIVFWCLYGPFSGTVIIGDPAPSGMGLRVGEMGTCLLIGMGGVGFLESEMARRCVQEERDRLRKPAHPA